MSRKKHSLFLLFMSLTVALFFCSCNRKTIYSHYEHTPVDGWGWDQIDTLYFDIPSLAQDGAYSEEIGLRCNTSYPFQELALIILQEVLPEGRQLCDTVTFRITDDNGFYQGQGVYHYHYSMPLSDLILHKGDSLHVAVCHIMRRKNVTGIADVGLTLQRK